MRLRKRIAVGTVCFCLFSGYQGIASAQSVVTSFGELAGKLKPGETVYVTDNAGGKIKGKLTALSSSSLELTVKGNRQTFPENRVLQITEQHRNTGKWAGIGLLVGGGLGLIAVVRSASTPCPGGRCEGTDSAGFAAIGVGVLAGMGAGIGAGIGAARTHEQLVYRAPNHQSTARFGVSPFVSKHGTGIAASVRF
jgi:hypothetical protein